jgi:SAM-dependent methyltransferase
LRAILAQPRVYDAFQRAVGATNVERVFVERVFRGARPRPRVLDIGCGPGDVLAAMPDVDYFGFDVSERYIASARERFGERGQFFVGDATSIDVATLGRFDRVVSKGVLHHLDDGEASRLLEAAANALAPDGLFATLDGCFSDRQGRVSRYIVGRDRGQNVRTSAGYEALARQWFDDVDVTEYDDLLRIPYSHCVLACARPRA